MGAAQHGLGLRHRFFSGAGLVGRLRLARRGAVDRSRIALPAQLLAAQSAGIAWGQGFLFARPAPAGDEPVRAESALFH